jgi:polyisoprenoid-binding protein YceI
MAVRSTFDPGPSRFTVQAFAKGLLAVFAHSPTFAVRDFAGELRFNPEPFGDAVLQVTVRADSLTLADNSSPRDRQEIERAMREEVLETAKYPEIAFRSTAVAADRIAEGWYRLRIRGELSLHGVKRGEAFEAQLRVLEGETRLSGEFPLRQSAYRIKPVSAVGGTITLKDELKLSFDIVGRYES